MERALWTDPAEEGGYIVDNGASLCGLHHIHAERNFFPPQACRNWAGITVRVLPKGLDPERWYNKWGQPIPSPTRDEVKYPSTMYLPFSPSIDVSERGLIGLDDLTEKPLVISLKMDGSNCMLNHERVAARNGDTATHPSFSLLKALHSEIKYQLDPDYLYFGEWLFARHSIHYTGKLGLSSYLQIFGIYHVPTQLWLGWDEVERRINEIGDPRVQLVPVVDKCVCEKPWQIVATVTEVAERFIKDGHEGIVVRNWYPFHHGDFTTNVAKYVRANHVQTDKHWSLQAIVRNEAG
jgi:hypothetical protein